MRHYLLLCVTLTVFIACVTVPPEVDRSMMGKDIGGEFIIFEIERDRVGAAYTGSSNDVDAVVIDGLLRMKQIIEDDRLAGVALEQSSGRYLMIYAGQDRLAEFEAGTITYAELFSTFRMYIAD